MIQDIAPKKLYNAYIAKIPSANDYAAVFSGNKILIKETDGVLRFPMLRELAVSEDLGAFQYLFCIDQDQYFLYRDLELLEEDCSSVARDGSLRFEKMPELRYQAEKERCFAAYTAYHLYRWYRDHQFCGRCGSLVRPDAKERMLFCDNCGSQIYPRIAPAVIVAVTDGDRILLTKYAGRAYTKYALIAGFTEIGETAEETVEREVMEEVGLRVKNIRYYKTQPWGIDGNFLIGYFAQLDGDDTIRMDPGELSVAEWVSRASLKDMDDGCSLTREMMRIFYECRENGETGLWKNI